MNVRSSTALQTSAAQRLYELFRGAEQRHLTYDWARAHRRGDNKLDVKDDAGDGYINAKGPPTPELWEKHLGGLRPLGVSPLREDGMCRYGVIDIDEYSGLDLGHLAGRIQREGLALVLTRSKSGGGHAWVFASEWMPQAAMNAALVAMAGRLGHADAETYPPAPPQMGNSINMPYFGGDSSDRCGVKPGGLGMTVAEFLAAAETNQQSPEAIAALGKSPKAKTEAFASRADKKLAEYCASLVVLVDGRKRALHNSAFAMGKYVLKGQISEVEVTTRLIAAGVAAGLQYDIAAPQVSNGLNGRLRQGAGADDDGDAENGRFPEIEKIVIITGGEEKLWRVTVAGYGDITLPSKEVWKNDLFNLRCAEELHVGFNRLTADKWADRLNDALQVAETEALPRDESYEGFFFEVLQDFCVDRYRAETLDEVLLGKPFTNDEDGRTYFRFGDFFAFLTTSRGGVFKGMSLKSTGILLRAVCREGVDFGKTSPKLKGVPTKLFWVRTNLFRDANAVNQVPLPKMERVPL